MVEFVYFVCIVFYDDVVKCYLVVIVKCDLVVVMDGKDGGVVKLFYVCFCLICVGE